MMLSGEAPGPVHFAVRSASAGLRAAPGAAQARPRRGGRCLMLRVDDCSTRCCVSVALRRLMRLRVAFVSRSTVLGAARLLVRADSWCSGVVLLAHAHRRRSGPGRAGAAHLPRADGARGAAAAAAARVRLVPPRPPARRRGAWLVTVSVLSPPPPMTVVWRAAACNGSR